MAVRIRGANRAGSPVGVVRGALVSVVMVAVWFAGPPAGMPAVGATTATGGGCASPISSWPRSQMIEQLIMVGGQFSSLGASAPMAAAGVGGFVFFGQPAAGSGPTIQSGLAGLANDAASHGQVIPWMSTDEEGGSIARLANVIGALPSPRQMAAGWTTAQAQAVMASHGAAMRSLGMTMDLAPVLDTANSADTIAGENYRSFSENGQVAAAYGLAYADGLSSAAVVPVTKHFPGLGHANANTDLGPATDPPLTQLENDDLIPFEHAIAAGLPVVMVGHPMVPGLTGGVPASLSPATYRFLRSSLGFQGVALTDDLGAGAVSAAGYSQPAAAVKALEAGADMVMVDAAQWSATVNALSQAITTGHISLASVEASVARILAAKSASANGYEVALQTSTHDLRTLGSVQSKDWTLGPAAGTSPSIGTFPAHGYQVALEANTGSLWTVGNAGNTAWSLAMRAGTSPSIAGLPTGGFEVAFQANTGSLRTVGQGSGAQNVDWHLGLMAGTSPSIAALGAGGCEVAFQANTGALWTVGNAGSTAWSLGMRAGTSPSIAALRAGGFEVAFQASTGDLWTVGRGPGAKDIDRHLGLMAGTSPSIAALPTGGFEVAFQANTGALWTVGSAGNTAWSLGMRARTSPSITALPTGGFEVAFQANSGSLWTVGQGSGAQNKNWQVEMLSGTSPSIHAAS